jgi:hypothetical protein
MSLTLDGPISGAWSKPELLNGNGVGKQGVVVSTMRQVVAMLRNSAEHLVASSNVTNGDGLNSMCGEELFRYLLASESVRAERSGSSFQLLLVMLLSSVDGGPIPMSDAVAKGLYASLKHCLRGTDYTGWYQDRMAMGAVLTALGRNELEEVSRQVEKRFLEASQERLSGNDWCNLRVRVCQQHEVKAGRVQS